MGHLYVFSPPSRANAARSPYFFGISLASIHLSVSISNLTACNMVPPISARGATSCPFSTRSSNLSSRAASRSSHARAYWFANPRSLWPNSSPWDGECLPFRQPSSDYPRNVYDRKCVQRGQRYTWKHFPSSRSSLSSFRILLVDFSHPAGGISSWRGTYAFPESFTYPSIQRSPSASIQRSSWGSPRYRRGYYQVYAHKRYIPYYPG